VCFDGFGFLRLNAFLDLAVLGEVLAPTVVLAELPLISLKGFGKRFTRFWIIVPPCPFSLMSLADRLGSGRLSGRSGALSLLLLSLVLHLFDLGMECNDLLLFLRWGVPIAVKLTSLVFGFGLRLELVDGDILSKVEVGL